MSLKLAKIIKLTMFILDFKAVVFELAFSIFSTDKAHLLSIDAEEYKIVLLVGYVQEALERTLVHL